MFNLGSVVSDVAVPLQGMYNASKHAVKGFADALRLELEEARAPISLTLVKSAAIDTPFPQHAGNYLPREPKLPPPVYPPEEVAHAILHAAGHPIRDIFVGGGGKGMNQYAPRIMDWVGSTFMPPPQQQRREPPRDPRDGLYRAGRAGRTRGDHPGYLTRTGLYTRSVTHPDISTGVVLAGLAAAVLLTSRNSATDGSK